MLWFGDKSTSAKKEVRRIANQAGKRVGGFVPHRGRAKGTRIMSDKLICTVNRAKKPVEID